MGLETPSVRFTTIHKPNVTGRTTFHSICTQYAKSIFYTSLRWQGMSSKWTPLRWKWHLCQAISCLLHYQMGKDKGPHFKAFQLICFQTKPYYILWNHSLTNSLAKWQLCQILLLWQYSVSCPKSSVTTYMPYTGDQWYDLGVQNS